MAAAAGTPENESGTALPLPPSPYLYMYALPNDCLQVRYLLPTYEDQNPGSPPMTPASVSANASYFGVGQIYFEVAYSKDALNNPLAVILTNQSQAQVVFTVNQPNPTTWDSLFQAAMVASLAAYLVPALSLNLPLMDRSVKAAESLIAQARARDGNEGVVSQNRQADWIKARVTGAGTAWTNYGAAMNGYGGMIWPTG